MKALRDILICFCLAATGGVLVCVMLLLHAATVAVAAIPARIGYGASALTAEVHGARVDLLSRVDVAQSAIQSRAERQIAAARVSLSKQIGNAVSVLDRRVGDSLAVATDQLSRANESIAGLRSDLQPVVAGAVAVESHADKAVVDLHPQMLGLVAASKVTAGETAQTMRDVQRAVPALLTATQDAVDHIDAASAASEAASQNAAILTGNLASATKPLPRVVRIGLQVAAPLAQISSYILLMLGTMGAL